MPDRNAFCRHQLPLDQYYGSLLLLKAQASAMIGNVAAADEAVQAWQDMPSIGQLGSMPTLTIPSRRKSTPSCWQASWSASAAAKDKGNDLFRKKKFAGDRRCLAVTGQAGKCLDSFLECYVC